MKLSGVEGYLRQIYWNNGSSVDDPYQRCLRLYLDVTHTHRGTLINILLRLDALYVFRLEDLLQLNYTVLKQFNLPARPYFFRMNCSMLIYLFDWRLQVQAAS